MTNETRSIARLVPLWIIFVISLLLAFWSVQQLAQSLTTDRSQDYSMGMKGYDAGMGVGYSNYCLTMPMYPMLSNTIMPETPPLTEEDKAAMEKYNKEMEKYNADYMVACKEDMAKQEKLRQQNKRLYIGSDVSVYAVLLLFSIFSAIVSFMAIRRAEGV